VSAAGGGGGQRGATFEGDVRGEGEGWGEEGRQREGEAGGEEQEGLGAVGGVRGLQAVRRVQSCVLHAGDEEGGEVDAAHAAVQQLPRDVEGAMAAGRGAGEECAGGVQEPAREEEDAGGFGQEEDCIPAGQCGQGSGGGGEGGVGARDGADDVRGVGCGCGCSGSGGSEHGEGRGGRR
jgi:hypothetical protein